MKFDISRFLKKKNLPIILELSLNSDKNDGALHEDLNTFIYLWILKMINVIQPDRQRIAIKFGACALNAG